MLRSALLNVMLKSAQKSRARAQARFRRGRESAGVAQGPADFVSAADHRAEDILFRRAQSRAPGLRLPGRGRRPTRRFRHDPHLDRRPARRHHELPDGIPHFAISLALEREGTIVAGVIYNPATDDLFTAEKGKGSFLNDRRLRVRWSLAAHGRGRSVWLAASESQRFST